MYNCHENSQQKLIEYLKGRVLVVSGPRHRRERQVVGEGFLGGNLGVERSVGPVSNLNRFSSSCVLKYLTVVGDKHFLFN